MKKENIVFIGVLVILLVFGIYMIFISPGNYDEFSKCLSEKAVLYGTDWCSACKTQKTYFGNSFEYINYKNCDYNKEECNSAGVRVYPTWVIDGKIYQGVRSLEELSMISGCSLE